MQFTASKIQRDFSNENATEVKKNKKGSEMLRLIYCNNKKRVQSFTLNPFKILES